MPTTKKAGTFLLPPAPRRSSAPRATRAAGPVAKVDRRRAAPTRIYPYNPRYCPFTATWNVIGGKWKGVIWWRLSNGVGRFGELQRAIPQVSKKVLTQKLREMQRDGLVQRDFFGEKVPRAEYSLTAYGRSLTPVIDAICRWGGAHLQRAETGKMNNS